MPEETTPFDEKSRAMAGDRLRRVRLQQGLSIRQLASMAGVSKTSVVQVEAGRTSRKSTYLKVAQVLGLHLHRLLSVQSSDERPYAVHRREDDAWFDLAKFDEGPLDSSITQEKRARLATECGVVPLNILASRLEQGRIKPTILEVYGPSPARSHAGEELIFVLEGKARIGIGDAHIDLGPGESVTFWSGEPHSYAPQPGSALPVLLLSVRVDS